MILLLTGCINPNGTAFTTLSNENERKKQYLDAIQYYLSHTRYKIVFAENSGTDISQPFQDAINAGRLEYITFVGNQNKERGKGYGECEILEYTLNHSKFIHSSSDKRIVKITGRLIVKNITTLIKCHQMLFSKRTISCTINSELSFPDSRLVIAPTSFWNIFIREKDNINDYKGYFFEHALCNTIKRELKFSYTPFFIMPIIIGISGTTGKEYSYTPTSFFFLYKYAKYALHLKRKFQKKYRT